MSAGGDLQRALGAFLAFHIAQVGCCALGLRDLGHRRRQHRGALHVIDQRDQGRRGQDVGAARKCRFRAIASGFSTAKVPEWAVTPNG